MTNLSSGLYNIEVFSYNPNAPPWLQWQPICNTNLTVFEDNVSIYDTTLTFCQGNTINLETILNSSITNGGLNPQYIFQIGNNVLNNSSYNLNSSGQIIIDASVTTNSGCTDSAIITINVISSNINIPSYTIEDNDGHQNIIQACYSNNSINFSVNNPDSTLTYSWIIDGGPTLPNPTTQIINGNNYPNPGIIEVSLQISDGSCSINIIDTINVVGIGNLGTWGVQSDPLPLCIDSSSTVFIINDNVPISSIGPGDTIIWKTWCGTDLIVDTIITSLNALPPILYSNQLIMPYAFEPTESSCGCTYPTLPSFYQDKYRIDVEIIPACGSSDGKVFQNQ